MIQFVVIIKMYLIKFLQTCSTFPRNIVFFSPNEVPSLKETLKTTSGLFGHLGPKSKREPEHEPGLRKNAQSRVNRNPEMLPFMPLNFDIHGNIIIELPRLVDHLAQVHAEMCADDAKVPPTSNADKQIARSRFAFIFPA